MVAVTVIHSENNRRKYAFLAVSEINIKIQTIRLLSTRFKRNRLIIFVLSVLYGNLRGKYR